MSSAVQRFLGDIPIVTKIVISTILLTTFAVELGVVSPLKLYLNPKLVLQNGEIWRIVTCFTYVGRMDVAFVYNLLFTYRHLRLLEEGPFDGKPADFLYMLMFGWIMLGILGVAWRLLFLGPAMGAMVMYVWCKKYPFLRASILGIVEFPVSYLPMVSLLLTLPFDDYATYDALGIIVGQTYYYLSDVYPTLPGGTRVLETPWFIKAVFGNQHENMEDSSNSVEYTSRSDD